MTIIPEPLPATNYWSVMADSSWFVNNWKASLDQHKAIVFVEACYSADNYNSIAASVGGRTVFAIHGEQAGAEIDALFEIITRSCENSAFPPSNVSAMTRKPTW